MKHYSKKEWQLYINGEIGIKQQTEMEDHLVDCDSCLKEYLSAVEAAELAEGDSLVSAGFTDNVMAKLKILEMKVPEKSKKKRSRSSNILIFYTAAACITLVFLSCGVFDSIGHYVPKTTYQMVDSTNQTDFLASGWSERLLDFVTVELSNQDKRGEELE
ncbi:anti-sigma factor family protein [Candidatus Contubernalis alkaliaceticus]|uniref:anti-sigma factor family protein n=1 Tax=Candidatus Contubernalis alkaliaceticus TaxID=338645 RepID=UPI001F4BE3C9|nr:hypothetical protein [Candidatus Contubernalis alkalaceticus]UNC93045.1 hypothetical protein HUE98_13660 [Candidatus Contubernalis alkalaceticus]